MFNQLRQYECVITPNRRLASFLSKQLAKTLSRNELYTGKIFAWQDFLRDCWELHRDKTLLSAWQSHCYWQAVISKRSHEATLLNTPETVHLTKQAHSLMQQYKCDSTGLYGIKPDCDLFLEWQEDYIATLSKNNLLDETDLPAYLIEKMQETPASTVLLYGFDALSPEQEALFNKLKKIGADVAVASLPARAKAIVQTPYTDIKQEIQSVASQVKAAFIQNPDPDFPYGVVVPQLSEHWRFIKDCFEGLPFNISAGEPLSCVPVVQTAFKLFDLLVARPDIKTWSFVLNSPFVASGISELPARAQLDFKLKQAQSQKLSWEYVTTRKQLPEQFNETLQGALKIFQEKPKAAKASEWQAWFLQWLQHWGWPGERNLNSEEYQAVTHFYRLFNEFAGLDLTLGEQSHIVALSQLKMQASSQMFQPESEDKPIQVLGMLEAAGLQFAKLWITGLSHDVWPEKPRPNPFIPTHIQVEFNMPHANAEREYAYAETLLNRLLTASETVNVSYAKYDLKGDSERLASPLIQHFKEQSIDYVAPESLAAKLQQSNAIASLPETRGVEFKAETLKGGAGLFKAQAACPFQSYAKYRLQAVAPELPVLGLSPRAKGIILHAALETLWEQIKTQSNLLELDEEALTKLGKQHLGQALKQIKPLPSKAQQALEMQRSLPLLQAWLNLEKARGHFLVEGTEVASQAKLAGVPLSLRLDRIDALPDGTFLLIDYKTGDVKAKDWLGLRPDEPQLPLYASLMDPPPSGIAFAVLRRKKVELISLNRENCDWQQQLTDWQKAIEQLALEFRAGRADLAPKNGMQTCQQCDLQLFCRVNEL